MAYKDGMEPQKGDAVIGTIGVQTARGKVMSWSKADDKILIERRGPAVFHEKSRQMIQGPIEQVEGSASDFVLLHRPIVRAQKNAPVLVTAGKEA